MPPLEPVAAARSYPMLTAARLLTEAADPPGLRVHPGARWDALVAAHGAERASELLRAACWPPRCRSADEVAERFGLEGYTPPSKG